MVQQGVRGPIDGGSPAADQIVENEHNLKWLKVLARIISTQSRHHPPQSHPRFAYPCWGSRRTSPSSHWERRWSRKTIVSPCHFREPPNRSRPLVLCSRTIELSQLWQCRILTSTAASIAGYGQYCSIIAPTDIPWTLVLLFWFHNWHWLGRACRSLASILHSSQWLHWGPTEEFRCSTFPSSAIWSTRGEGS